MLFPLKFCGILLAAIVVLARPLPAHDGLDLSPPITLPEAWNILTLCGLNLEKLVEKKQIEDLPVQAFLSAHALRFLQQQPEAGNAVRAEEVNVLLAEAEALADPARSAEPALEVAMKYLTHLRELARGTDPKLVNAAIFSCPMCKGIREVDSRTRCPKCGMPLVARFIPATGTPGEPQIVLTPSAAPLIAGQRSEVKIRFTWRRDGGAVNLGDLLVVHTEPIHLLIVDESLDDYHHEHPRATGVPGEFAFAFTPRRPGSYRIFADLTPRVSGAQEYPQCDLPGTAPGGKVVNHAATTTSNFGGLNYELRWLTGGGPVVARRPVSARVTITEADGAPFQKLEPLMDAYAHIVGFYEDRSTVLHIHPTDLEPRRPTDRGGPTFTFRLFAPRPGFVRLFCQTQVAGLSQFAPFGLVVADPFGPLPRRPAGAFPAK